MNVSAADCFWVEKPRGQLDTYWSHRIAVQCMAPSCSLETVPFGVVSETAAPVTFCDVVLTTTKGKNREEKRESCL